MRASRQLLALACATFVGLATQTRAATWYVSAPITNASPLRFSAIGAGGFSLGVQSNGMVVAWGYGQIGVPGDLTNVISVAAGVFHGLALKSDGTVLAWGDNTYGQTNVPPGLSNVVAISAQNYNSLALRSDGGVARWGWIGDIYAPVPGDLTNAAAIAAGGGHNLAIRAGGTVEAWGQNGQGQCNVPADLTSVVGIAAGNGYSLALKGDGTVVSWGSSTNVPSGLSGVIAISAGWGNCAALKSNGTVITWGANLAVPPGLSNVVAIATGIYHDLALRSDGSVVAWANNDNCSGQFEVPGGLVAGGDIQGAVNQARDGDTVLLGPGWYEPTNQVVITNAIVLRSVAGADQTILNVKFDNYAVAVSNSAAVVDGLTLRGGFFDNCHPVSERGAGIFLVGGTIQNCQFTNSKLTRIGVSVYMLGGVLSNSVVSYGAWPEGYVSAVYCGAGGVVTDCRIMNGFGGAYFGKGVYLERSQLRNSVVSGFLGGDETAGGWAVDAHWSTIVGCTITPTPPWEGSGANLDNCVMDRCLVINNANRGCSFEKGGGGIYESNSVVLNSLILGNGIDREAPDCGDEQYGQCGGGVFMNGGALVNCTVVGNGASHGSGVYIKSGSLTNCIIYGNRNYNGANDWEIAGPAIFDHCCTTPDPGGRGNIIFDPQFVSPTNGDFHLLPGSLCNSAGVVQDWMTGAFDLDANPRTTYGFVDIGAYQTMFGTPQDRAEGLIGAVAFLVRQGVLR